MAAAQGRVARRVMDRLMVVLFSLLIVLGGVGILALYLGWAPFSEP